MTAVVEDTEAVAADTVEVAEATVVAAEAATRLRPAPDRSRWRRYPGPGAALLFGPLAPPPA